MKGQKTIFLTGIITAFAASLCCIAPVLALVAGTSGLFSTFSWLEPFRPWLIGLTLVVLSFAWYKKLKPKETDDIDCECEKDEKPSFYQSKKFLGIVTVFSVLMLTFPSYADIFFPKPHNEITVVDRNNIQQAEFKIHGMTCTGCEAHVEHEINQLNGIITAEASYEDGNAIVEFDQTFTNIDSIKSAISNTGYKIVSITK